MIPIIVEDNSGANFLDARPSLINKGVNQPLCCML